MNIDVQYVAQKKKQELEEKRLKQKKAREEFAVMLQVFFLTWNVSFLRTWVQPCCAN